MIILQPSQQQELLKLLQNGAVGIMPTDTIYGLVACAAQPQAVASLYRAKHRDTKPGTVIAAHTDQLESLGIDKEYLARVAYLWPAALSIVLPDHAALSYLDLGKHSLAVRIPASKNIRRLLEETGPLLTTSANMPGLPPSMSVDKAIAYFGDTVDFYVDGGPLPTAVPSTVVKLHQDGQLEVLRAGAFTLPRDTDDNR